MSRASKITLGLTSAFAAGVVLFVHYGKHNDQAAMHAGVIRDIEQRQIRDERMREFEEQQRLEREYKKLQNVNDATHLAPQTPPGSNPA